MYSPNQAFEPLMEEKVRKILQKDELAAKNAGARSFWKVFHENLNGLIPDADMRNTVFLHAVKSLQYTSKQSLTEATTSSAVATYNKAMLPTIITRVFPELVATKFIATRQLDVPTQVIQTFRLSKNTAKNDNVAGQEWFDPSLNKKWPTATPAYQENNSYLDANYSSQSISGETAPALDTGGTGLTFSPVFTPILPGSVVVYAQSDTDPRTKTAYAQDDGAGKMVLYGTSTQVGTITYGTLNGSAGTITTNASWGAAGAGLTYNVAYAYQLERNKQLSEISFKQSLIQVTAKGRKNYAQISAEAIQDLEAYTEGKLDALKELVAGMSESMALEIDKELIMAMMSSAGKIATFDNQYPAGEFRGTQFQRNQELVHKMNSLANDMSLDFLRGEGMFTICHPHVYSILQNTNEFRMADMSHKPQGTAQIKADGFGQLNNFTVARAVQMPYSDKILMGFTSKDLTKAPYAYFPFVTYLTPPQPDILSGDIFSTVVGLQQRYDHKPLLDGQYGLGVLNVSNLYV